MSIPWNNVSETVTSIQGELSFVDWSPAQLKTSSTKEAWARRTAKLLSEKSTIICNDGHQFTTSITSDVWSDNYSPEIIMTSQTHVVHIPWKWEWHACLRNCLKQNSSLINCDRVFSELEDILAYLREEKLWYLVRDVNSDLLPILHIPLWEMGKRRMEAQWSFQNDETSLIIQIFEKEDIISCVELPLPKGTDEESLRNIVRRFMIAPSRLCALKKAQDYLESLID